MPSSTKQDTDKNPIWPDQDPSEYTGRFDPVMPVDATADVAPAEQPRVQRPAEAPRIRRSQRFRAYITRWRMMGVAAWAVVMVLGAFVGLLFFARPATSAVEMRNLTTFPQVTLESFFNGSFFTDVSLWYADTYPLREPMVAADHGIDSLFGVSVNGALVGGNVKADEIPVEDEEDESDELESSESSHAIVPADPPDAQVVAEDIQANIMDGVYVKDGAGYSIYYFDQQSVDTYIAAMNKAAERLDGIATVYSIMSPANSILLDADEADALGGSDQEQTLAYMNTRFDGRVKSVEIVDDLTAHRDEYLYFYSDHHWTQLGAYYAYEAFCKAKGIEAVPLTKRKRIDLGEFHGTYYDTIASVGGVRDDAVEAYIPIGTNELTYYSEGDEGVTGAIVDEAAVDWDPPYKYSAFAQGDEPLETIHNPQINDGSSCLVVKDSYGCAFVPLLVDSYQDVHVIDFRYTDKNICDYVKENDIEDVIFITGMKIGLTQTVADTLLSEVS